MFGVRAVSRAFLVAVVAALVLPAFAHAALTPVVSRVAAPDRHPVVTWTLPPNVQAEAVEVATRPEIGDYDQFLGQNVIVGESVAPDATSWSDPTTRLDPGTYYVHVLGWDQSCAVGMLSGDDPPDAVCDHVVSPTVTLVVKNAAPRVSHVHFIVDGTTTYATFRLCDDASGPATIILRDRKRTGERTLARYTRGIRVDAHAGCGTYRVTDGRHVALHGAGRLRVTVQALDYDGAYSKVALGRRAPLARTE